MTDHEEETTPDVIVSGLYCPEDGGDLQAFAVLGQKGRTVEPLLRLLCRECGWTGVPREAIER